MQLTVHGKQINIGDALRGYVEDSRTAVITKYTENPTDARVTGMATQIEQLAVSEAVMYMDHSGHLALLFHNSASDAIDFVYVQSDSNIGRVNTNNTAQNAPS